MEGVIIRAPRVGDGAAVAETQRDSSGHLAELAPALFRAVTAGDQETRLERLMLDRPNPDALFRIAEVDGRVVGYIYAVLQHPDENAERQTVRYLGQTRLWINSLAVRTAYHRRGIATHLMAAAEEWGRAHGAELVRLDTWADSPESVPFYEKIGYQRRAIIFEKDL